MAIKHILSGVGVDVGLPDEDARHVELLVPMTNERVCFSKTEVAS